MPFPTNIQWRGNASIGQGSGTQHTCRLIDPTEAGDTVFITGQFGSGTDVVSAVADDAGGTLANGAWVKDKFQPNATDNQSVIIMRRSGCPKGLSKAIITFSVSTGFYEFHALKANMIAPGSPVNGTAVGANPAATSSLAAGNITTTEADCFFIYCASMTSVGVQSSPVRFSASADTSDLQTMLWAPDSTGVMCSMYGIKRSAGTFNPTMTSDRSWTRSAVAACAYRTMDGVGSPALSTLGMRLKFWLNIDQASWITSGAGLGTIQTYDLPCDPAEVNAVAIAYSDPNKIFVGATPSAANVEAHVSSSPANTWKSTTPINAGSAGAGTWIGFVNAIKGSFKKDTSLTLTFTSSPTTSATMQSIVYGIVNAEAFDAEGHGGANPNVAVPTTQTSVLSTDLVVARGHSLVLALGQEDQQSISDMQLRPAIRPMNPGTDDPGIYELSDGVHDGGFGHANDVPAGTYDLDISWVNYEGAFNLTNYGAVVISISGQPPYEVPPRLMGQQIF